MPFKKGKPPWNKGTIQPRGEKSPNWKGDRANYFSIHVWVAKWKGKPQKCEVCGIEHKGKKMFDWANIDHKYRRVLDDYIRMCRSCHRRYDRDILKIKIN